MTYRRRSLAVIVVIFLIAAALGLKLLLDTVWRLPVLMYHSIDYTTDQKNKMVVSPETFGRQMKFLRDHRYNVITLDEAVRYISQKKRPPSKTVAITIDDGYEDNYKHAYPRLKDYRIPATTFVIVDLVGKHGFMRWDQIGELSDSGLVDIESHTMSHPWLTGLGEEELKRELEESKAVLEKRLGKKVDYLCYPMGEYNEAVKKAARGAGYKAAFATKPRRLVPNYDLYEIKRVRISPTSNNLFIFAIKLSGYHAFLRLIQNDYKDLPYLLWKKRKF